MTDDLIRDCEVAAKYYRDNPGHVNAETIVDLYQTIVRLARIVAARSALNKD